MSLIQGAALFAARPLVFRRPFGEASGVWK